MVNRPLYQRVANTLFREMAQGRLRVGDRLPTETELMAQYRVSRVTIRQALEVLRQRGLVERFAGRGSFVSRPRDASVWTLQTVEDVARAGAETDVRLLSWRVVRVPPVVEKKLPGLGRTAYRLRGVRRTSRLPLYYEEIYLPVDVGRRLSTDDLGRTTVLELIETKVGIPLVRGEEEISAAVVDHTIARHLGIPAAAPALILDLVYFDPSDRAVVYVKAVYRADRFTRRNELRRRPELRPLLDADVGPRVNQSSTWLEHPVTTDTEQGRAPR
jgi:GntR family transcriptional regulator